MLKNQQQTGQPGQRMMLTTTGNQVGQMGQQIMTQQIIVPANFQGNTLNIKTLQGLKMIPIQQGNKVLDETIECF